MRKIVINRGSLLAGTVLAITAAIPATSPLAQPNSLRTAPPPPAMMPARRELAPAPAPAPLAPRAENNAHSSRAEAEPPAPVAAEPSKQATDAGFDIRAALDKMFAASDAQISEKLRAMVTTKQLERRVTRPAERAAIEGFYSTRNFAAIWIKDGQLTPRAKNLVVRLKNAGADGLDATDYPVPDFASASGADALADADVKLTESALNYARNLQVGRIAPTRVSAEVDYGSHAPDPAEQLRQLASASDIDGTLDSYNPPYAGFRALKGKLAELRANASADEHGIAEGTTLKPGMQDPRVPQLRERLGLRGNPADLTYDIKLAQAVKNIQARANLPPKGILDNKTIAYLNGPKPSDRIETIVANLERWRWLPRELGKTYVMVNIPDYTLKVVRDKDVIWRTKIVAGKPQTPTPLLSAPMDHVLVNPSWYVPQSIIQNELLPQYESDPNIFERLGLEVKRGPDGNINVVQPPGAANALGRIKFAFPNKFQVYLHDTPEKKLFSYDRRAFSHGCMRVEDPTKFGEVMLHLAMNGPTPNSQQIYAMFGHEEKMYKLQNRPMVHLVYQTAFVDESGKLVMREDLYGFDNRIHAILNSDERRVADVAPPADPKRDLATAKSNQEILRRVERREAHNPFAFFERLFR